MKNSFRVIAAFFFILAICCSAASLETKIPINFSASQFNSISSVYMSRPTFATLHTKEGGRSWLDVSMEKYGTDAYGNSAIINSFSEKYCDDYIALIDKYLEWESVAQKDGDMIDKKIGSAKNVSLGLSFYFYSANSANHFLTIGYSKEYSQYYSREDAIALKSLLFAFKNNDLKAIDVESKYK